MDGGQTLRAPIQMANFAPRGYSISVSSAKSGQSQAVRSNRAGHGASQCGQRARVFAENSAQHGNSAQGEICRPRYDTGGCDTSTMREIAPKRMNPRIELSGQRI